MPGKTMKVRILVRVGNSPKGGLTYAAAGWGASRYGHENRGPVKKLVDELAHHGEWVDGGRYTWVTAEVPAPDVEATVEGAVEFDQ